MKGTGKYLRKIDSSNSTSFVLVLNVLFLSSQIIFRSFLFSKPILSVSLNSMQTSQNLNKSARARSPFLVERQRMRNSIIPEFFSLKKAKWLFRCVSIKIKTSLVRSEFWRISIWVNDDKLFGSKMNFLLEGSGIWSLNCIDLKTRSRIFKLKMPIETLREFLLK